MSNTTIDYKELNCIRVDHTYEGVTNTSYISWNTFVDSYINERWDGERRIGNTMTMFGPAHTIVTVPNPYDGEISKRVFNFPSSKEMAATRHRLYS